MAGEEYDTEAIFTLPNALSALRLVGVPVFLWLVVDGTHDLVAVGVLAVAGLTDWLDGYLARTWRQRSRVGQLLDPMADRLYILTILIGLAARHIVPWWLLALLLARDVMLACLVPFLKTRGFASLPVHFLGKAATFALLYAFPLVLLGNGVGPGPLVAKVFGWASVLWGTGLYWWAGFLYVRQTVDLLRRFPRLPRHTGPARRRLPGGADETTR